MPRLFNAVVVLVAVLLSAFAHAGEEALRRPLTVHFFDVGQGDAALIVSPTGKTVLIDGGPPGAASRLATRLEALVPGRPIDLVVLSHPHLDHLGGLRAVLDAVGARRFLDPGFDHPSLAYAQLLERLGENTPLLSAERDPEAPDEPIVIGLGDGASLTVVWPRRPVEPFLQRTRSDANANSLVLRLQHGEVSFLFVGDAEEETERRLVREKEVRGVTVLKVAHHGSRHSSTTPFLTAARPRFAVISSGAGNEYGHPSAEALTRLSTAGATVFRTDLHGEVTATSDGAEVRFHTTRRSTAEAVAEGASRAHDEPVRPTSSGRAAAARLSSGYVASRRSEVFHQADCAGARTIAKQNVITFADRAEAARQRRPAKDCNP